MASLLTHCIFSRPCPGAAGLGGPTSFVTPPLHFTPRHQHFRALSNTHLARTPDPRMHCTYLAWTRDPRLHRLPYLARTPQPRLHILPYLARPLPYRLSNLRTGGYPVHSPYVGGEYSPTK